MTVAWPDMGPAPEFLDDPAVVAGFCVLYAMGYRAEDEDRGQGLWRIALDSAPCKLTEPRSREFHELAREAWDALEDQATAAPGAR